MITDNWLFWDFVFLMVLRELAYCASRGYMIFPSHPKNSFFLDVKVFALV